MRFQKYNTSTSRRRILAARCFILTGLAVLVFGVAYSFAAQSGVFIGNRLVDHQHTSSGDGGKLQGLAPLGTFWIYGNNNGAIRVSTSINGGNFIWYPKRQTMLAGFATTNEFYDNNVGTYSWVGGFNTMSKGSYSLAHGAYVRNTGVSSHLMGYYLNNRANDSVMIGHGAGADFGLGAYAVNDDTGSIKFWPFYNFVSSVPALAMLRDGSNQAEGTWNFRNAPMINGIGISTSSASDTSRILKTGDIMSGPLQTSSLTVTGSGFSVGGSTFACTAGKCGVGTANPLSNLEVNGTGPAIRIANSAGGAQANGLLMYTNENNVSARNWGMYTTQNARGALEFLVSPSSGTNPATTVLFMAGAGQIGINTTTPDPAAKLNVAGNISTTGQVISSGTGTNFFSGDIQAGANTLRSAQTYQTNYLGLASGGYILFDANATSVHRMNFSGGGINISTDSLTHSLFTIKDGTGFVGISSTTPAAQLGVTGGAIISSSATVQGGLYLTGANAPATGGAVCLNASFKLSKCTTAPDASGNCTCP